MGLVWAVVLARNNLTALELHPVGWGARLQAAIDLMMLCYNYRQCICPQPCHAVEGESALPATAVGLLHAM